MSELRGLPRGMVTRVMGAVSALAENPYSAKSKKLVGSRHTYRIRIGDYRVVYNVVADEVVIEVIKVGHRRDVYR